MTKLRRLRGLVAAELAGSDDIRIVVRRATLTLESGSPTRRRSAGENPHGAVWLADLPLADRLAEAAIRAGADRNRTSFGRTLFHGWAAVRKRTRYSRRSPPTA